MIASNIANADTPGYKAQGMDFQKALAQATQQQQSLNMQKTNAKHFDIKSSLTDGLMYRTPDQPDTGDGNTVNAQLERNLYLENSLEYQASLQFVNSKIQGLKKALGGGQS